MTLYPLLMEPIYKQKVWGGRTLERFGRALPGGPEVAIGESWELADLGATSPGGGGGAAARSRIRNGPLAKRELGDVIRDFGSLVVGDVPLAEDGSFPLLVKYLDARENLSIQVHPSPEYAATHPDAHLKSEAWYVVDADPGAVIYKGVVAGTSRAAFAEAIRSGDVVDLMIDVPARPGDCHYLPSGTCHALGGGVLVAEVQTPSDTTFRVYDWGRTDRELHVAEALACIDFGPPETGPFEPGTKTRRPGATERSLVRCEHFWLGELEVEAGHHEPLPGGAPVVLMVLEGTGAIVWGEDGGRALRVGAGDTVVLPAALGGASLDSPEEMTVLRVTVPDS